MEIAALKFAINLLTEKLEELEGSGRTQRENTSVLRSSAAPAKTTGKRQMSAAGRARIAAAQRARWAKKNQPSQPAVEPVPAPEAAPEPEPVAAEAPTKGKGRKKRSGGGD